MATPSILQTTVGEVTECAICTETMVDPKSLPCIHTYCFKCLDRLWNDKQPGESVPCPLCRTKFVIPVDGVSNLPRNFFVEKLLEAQKLSNTENVHVMCDMCAQNQEDGDGVSAGEMFCVDCQQNMCQRCYRCHSSIKSLKTHRVYSLENKPDMMDLIHFPERHCDQHKQEQIKIFCTECKVAACMLCFMTQHNGHKCSDMQQVAENLKIQMRKDIDETRNSVIDVSDQTENLQKLLADFMTKITNTEAMIVEKGEELKKAVDVHVADLLQDLFAEKTKKMKKIENIKEELMVQKISLESFIKYSEKLLEKAVPADIATEAGNLNARAETLKKMEKIRIGNQFEVSFVPSSLHFPALNQKFENNLIGKIKVGGTVVRVFLSLNNSIEVTNIDKNIKEQTLEMLFENAKRHGGGEITTMDYEEGSGKAIISFKDPDVARRLINKGSVEHKNVKMSIKGYSGEKREDNKSFDVWQSEEVCRITEPSSFKGQAVEVGGIPKDVSKEVLQMIFECKRYGGGPIERLVYEQNGIAVIWFQDSKVAQGLLAKEVVTYKDHRMFVKIHKEESRSRDYPSTGARNKEPARGSFSFSNEALQIREIPPDFTYQMLERILSNKRYGGGEFDRLDYTPGGDGTAVVWFKNPQIIASVLRQEVIDFKGHRMFVTSHQSNSMPSNDESYQSYQQISLPAQASLHWSKSQKDWL